VSSNSSVSAGKLVRLIAGGSVRQECWSLTRAEVVELHEALGLVRDKQSLSSLRNLNLQRVI